MSLNCLLNEFMICFDIVAVFVLNVIVLLFVSVFVCWRHHALLSRVCVCICQSLFQRLVQ